jgi:Phage terminase large subunit
MSRPIPTYKEFVPVIPYQAKVIKLLEREADYSKGVHEVFLSGSVGSAKSLLMAHMAVKHCVRNPGATLGLARRAMPDLKATIFQDILDHLEGSYVEGKHYFVRRTVAQVTFANGSRIVSRSWADKKYKKWRSLRLSAAIVEELTENDDEDKEAIDELRMRVGRLPGIKQNFIIYASNPDSPEHWAYKYFIKDENKLKRVFYSVTTDNPFLPKSYIENLKKNLDPLMAERMIYGKWIRIAGETLYRQYSKEKNFINKDYEINTNHPIRWAWDFNIGEGKPMSTVFFQYIGGVFHFFKEIIVEGTRTEDICQEAGSDGILDHNVEYIIHGDATGRSRSTKSITTDYDIIRKFLSNYKTKKGDQLRFKTSVPMANPPLRKRHNLMNGLMLNAAGQTRLYVYKGCPILDEGFLLTKLKSGGHYIEDDSKKYQHCTTSAGYGCCSTIAEESWDGALQLIPR